MMHVGHRGGWVGPDAGPKLVTAPPKAHRSARNISSTQLNRHSTDTAQSQTQTQHRHSTVTAQSQYSHSNSQHSHSTVATGQRAISSNAMESPRCAKIAMVAAWGYQACMGRDVYIAHRPATQPSHPSQPATHPSIHRPPTHHQNDGRGHLVHHDGSGGVCVVERLHQLGLPAAARRRRRLVRRRALAGELAQRERFSVGEHRSGCLLSHPMGRCGAAETDGGAPAGLHEA